MSIDASVKDLVKSCLKESKRLEAKAKHLEALIALEKVSQHCSSRTLSVSFSLTKQVASLCNTLALCVPNKIPYLRRAEQTLTSFHSMSISSHVPFNEKIFRLTLLTYNNWATYHQASKNYHMALSYLLKGIQVINSSEIKEADSYAYVAKTKLNISALYSELHRYPEAIEFAEECLSSLQREIKLRLGLKEFRKLEGKEKKKAEAMFEVYVIAFYNIGVAEELRNRREAMQKAYRNAVEIGLAFLGEENQVVKTAQRAIEEAGSKGTVGRGSINIPVEMLRQKTAAEAKYRLSASESLTGRGKISATPNPKKPGRYYSDLKLLKIQQKLENDSKLHFISVDQYFYKEISKLMDVKSDIRHLKPLSTSGAMTLWERETEEKRKISDLRLKKQRRWHSDMLEISEVEGKIVRLKEADQEELKLQEVKLKSKMKTKVYKQLLRSISTRGHKYSFPAQKLFFKPPLKESISRRESVSITSEAEKKAKTARSEKQLVSIQSHKDEIENIMERINSDIRKIDIEKGVSKAQPPDVFLTERIIRDNKLAKSTLKGLTSGKEKLKFLKSAIGDSMKNPVKKASPKVLLRTNTLIGYIL